MSSHICTLVEVLGGIEDPRRQNRNTKLTLIDILGLSMGAVFAGADEFVEIALWAEEHEDFLKSFLDLQNGILSDDTINRVFPSSTPWFSNRRCSTGSPNNEAVLPRRSFRGGPHRWQGDARHAL